MESSVVNLPGHGMIISMLYITTVTPCIELSNSVFKTLLLAVTDTCLAVRVPLT